MHFFLAVEPDHHTGALYWTLSISDRRGTVSVPVGAAVGCIPTDSQPPTAVLIAARAAACDLGYQLPAPSRWKQVGPARYMV